MAISWGSWEYSGGNGMRVGIEVTTSSVTTSSSSVTFTVKIYTENQYSYGDGQTLTYGGSISGSLNFTNSSGSSAVLRDTETHVYTYSTYGSSPGTRTFTATISGAYNGVTPTKSYTATIPARPYAAPNAPSAATATRNSDSQITIGWTRNATTQRPYSSIVVQRAIYSGTAWSSFSTVATLSGSATSYVNTGLSSNRVYDYRIYATNSIGNSSYLDFNATAMTPASPSSVTAAIAPAGTSITVTWVPANYSGTYQPTFTIERSVNGGAYSSLFTGQSGTSKVDPSPGVGTNRYRVKAVYNALSFTGTESNTVTTIVAPLAPTVLDPTGAVLDMVASATVLTWQHNQGGDGAAQSAYQVQFSNNGGSTWVALDTGTVTSANSTHTVNAGVLANGASYQWRVRTQGITSGGWGPYSAVATITSSGRPTLTIGNPPVTTTSLPVTVGWTYSQAQSSPQSNWMATLKDSGGTILEAKSGAGTTASTTFSAPVIDGETYTVEVQVQSTAGLWSTVVTDTTTVDLLPPANVTTVGLYDACSGAISLEMTAAAPVGGTTVAVSTVTVERRLPGGEWVRIAEGVSLTAPVTIIDPIPACVGDNEYRVTAASASPSYAVMAPITVAGTNNAEHWAFLSYGSGFTSTLRLRSALTTSASSGRSRSVEPFAGRSLPALLVGEQRTRVVNVAGTSWYDSGCGDPGPCAYDSSRDEWEEASWEAEVVCYRDWTGRRMFGMLSDVSTSDLSPGISTVGFSITQSEYDEIPGYVA